MNNHALKRWKILRIPDRSQYFTMVSEVWGKPVYEIR